MLAHAVRPASSCGIVGRKLFHKGTCLSSFYESEKSGYPPISEVPRKKLSPFGHFREGCRALKEEIKLFKDEMIEGYRLDPKAFFTGDDFDPIWTFDKMHSRDQWTVACDSDYAQGSSVAKLEISESGTGIFSGTLNTALPKDGKIKQTGYCNITTIPRVKSFRRTIGWDWGEYNYLKLRVRGDGRCYMLNLLKRGYYDIFWHDCYHYVMYTRGGPYWQEVKIPFSKFFFSSKGTIQDTQCPIIKTNISNFGITLSDKVSGPFKLEIDYIGVGRDSSLWEKFAYEMYSMRKD